MTHLLLAGGGHSHAIVLRDWLDDPLPGVTVTLVSPSASTLYSGMVPGWLAGHYGHEEITIDVEALCRAAGVRFRIGTVVSLDPVARTATLADGETLAWDVLSLDVGSTLTPPADACRVLALRPLGELQPAWSNTLADLAALPTAEPLRITAVGGGAAGIEALLAVLARLRALLPGRQVQASLVSSATELLPGMARGAARSVGAALTAAGVSVQLGRPYERSDRLSDLLLWATGAEAHHWQRHTGLAVGRQGFIRIDAQLRSLSHPHVYATGDCAEWAEPLPKAGVYAVRMGQVLSRNLRAALVGGRAAAYKPQRRYLALLSTADGRAVATWGNVAASGRWAWRWKDSIDRAFVARFRVGPGRAPAEAKLINTEN